jgi:hypothetical protein
MPFLFSLGRGVRAHITAEKIGHHIANRVFHHNWRSARRALFDPSWPKGAKESVRDEFLVFLYFCGDFSLLFTGIHNDSVFKRMRDSYIRMWQSFVIRVSPTALEKCDKRLSNYLKALRGEGIIMSPKRYDDFISRTIGRLFISLSGLDTLDVKLFATKTWSATTLEIANYVREMNERYGVV